VLFQEYSSLENPHLHDTDEEFELFSSISTKFSSELLSGSQSVHMVEASSILGAGLTRRMLLRWRLCELYWLLVSLLLALSFQSHIWRSMQRGSRSWSCLLWLLGGLLLRVSGTGFFIDTRYLSECPTVIMHGLFPSLSIVSCLAIAACLTPTDPIIAAAIVGKFHNTNIVILNLNMNVQVVNSL
jgi:hypothetical protein